MMYKLNNTIHINISDVKISVLGEIPAMFLSIYSYFTHKNPFMKLTTCVK